MNIKGNIHSIETCGTVDGPGIRFVIFTQGCPLRCQYCHNPDTWKTNEGNRITVDELIAKIKKYKSYMKFSAGGVTLTGGEPLLQPEFAKELFKKCKEENIHTTIDTSGFISLEKITDVLEYTDLVLLDIKSFNPTLYKDLTGVSNNPTIKLAKYLSDINKLTWIRHVIVPNLTDKEEDLIALAEFLSSLNNIEKVELLPFHKMGEYKWEELGYKYKLKNTSTPSEETMEMAVKIFKERNVNVIYE
ncbi:pyruvate formate lyase-activating protein [Clostridium sp. D2Q-14]|uniref:pyruvate formate-lyase-activating protein n=1 Tax=Anaeromonas gelatinilytica TaxID=2683194 RepID=UPI00193C4281|nr:pyruvate formate-lyase-activating protein [Anaeromonas gelatinilytica]MBS4534592.1 pyruvate formate lyase-activating protein [Anaeromonas gelatinilytica]